MLDWKHIGSANHRVAENGRFIAVLKKDEVCSHHDAPWVGSVWDKETGQYRLGPKRFRQDLSAVRAILRAVV